MIEFTEPDMIEMPCIILMTFYTKGKGVDLYSA